MVNDDDSWSVEQESEEGYTNQKTILASEILTVQQFLVIRS